MSSEPYLAMNQLERKIVEYSNIECKLLCQKFDNLDIAEITRHAHLNGYIFARFPISKYIYTENAISYFELKLGLKKIRSDKLKKSNDWYIKSRSPFSIDNSAESMILECKHIVKKLSSTRGIFKTPIISFGACGIVYTDLIDMYYNTIMDISQNFNGDVTDIVLVFIFGFENDQQIEIPNWLSKSIIVDDSHK